MPRIWTRIESRINFEVWKRLWSNSNFIRHGEVADARTNPGVGVGLGLARTVDPVSQAALIWRYGNSPFRNRGRGAALDLGCGDGAMLRTLRLLRFSPIIGVEADPELAALAKANEPSVEVICDDFTSESFANHLTKHANRIKVVYLFNPAPPLAIVEALKILSRVSSFRCFLRNPVAQDEICRSVEIETTPVAQRANLWIFDVSKRET